jgi:hypothetical protein
MLDIVFPEKVFKEDTPEGMLSKGLYRIPPRVFTDLKGVEAKGPLEQWGGKTIALGVPIAAGANDPGQSETNGNGLIQFTLPDGRIGDYREYYDFTAATEKPITVKIRGFEHKPGPPANGGVYQTAPGKAGRLFLQAFRKRGDKDYVDASEKKSSGFSVAAIPVGVKMGVPQTVDARDFVPVTEEEKQFAKDNWVFEWGGDYPVEYVSDSDNPADLDKVLTKEVIDVKEKTNSAKFLLQTLVTSETDPKSATASQSDFHSLINGVPKADFAQKSAAKRRTRVLIARVIKDDGAGVAQIAQKFVFQDGRTSMTEYATIGASGFGVTFDFDKQDAGNGRTDYRMRLKKAGMKVEDTVPGQMVEKADKEVSIVIVTTTGN